MEKRIEIEQGIVYAHVEGAGPAVLLAHGIHPESTWQLWEHNVTPLAEAGFQVYALDLLGYGQSSSPRLDHEGQAQVLLALMDAEGLQTATFGGVSWGGMIALQAALTAPERVARLVLVDSAGAGHFSEQQLEQITCPALVVWGEDDSVLPLAHAAWFGAALRCSQVAVIQDVTQQEGVPPWGGHHPMRFKPAEFNRILIPFLLGTNASHPEVTSARSPWFS